MVQRPLAISTDAVFGPSWEHCLDVARVAGCKVLHVDLRCEEVRQAASGLANAAEFRAASVADLTPELAFCAWAVQRGFAIQSLAIRPSPDVADWGDAISRCREFGIGWLIVDLARFMPQLSEVAAAPAALTRLAAAAAAAGVTPCLETQWPLCGNHRQMLETLAAWQPAVWKLNLDLGRYQALNIEACLETALLRLTGYFASLRIADLELGGYNAGSEWPGNQPIRFAPLGQGGSLDLGRVGQILRDTAYGGAWCWSFTALSKEHFERGLRTSLDNLARARITAGA